MRKSGLILIVTSVIVFLAVSLAVQPAHAQGQIHIVQRGETVWSISLRYGTTPEAITQANGLSNPRYIYAGQQLIIPTGGGNTGWAGSNTASGTTYVVRRGDNLSSIAVQYGTTIDALVRTNGLSNPSYIYAGQRLIIPGSAGGNTTTSGSAGASGGHAYVVQRGDTLSAIAYRYGTTVAAIAGANGISNPSYIYPGQQLRIPAAGAAVPGTAPAAAPGSSKRIVVDLSAQRMYVYQNGQLIWDWVVSTGRPGQSTAVGSYRVQNKIPNAYASTWNLQMPYWLGIYWAGSLQNGIHALPIQANGQRLWDGYLGQPVSFGCIILSTQNAATLYNWATVGTPVDIVW